MGIFSVSVFSAGGSYSENGGFSANVWYYNYNQYNGFSVNPSVSVGYTATTGNYGTYDVKDPGGLDRDDPIPYDRTAAYKFMCDNDLTNSNHQWENLYADGTVLHGYTYDNGEAKNKEGKPVLGVTQGRGKQYLFWGKEKSDIYFYKAAFRNPEMLFYVIQHELVHVNLNYAGVRNSNAHEAAAYRLTADQLKAWGLSSSFYQGQANSYFAKYPYLHPHQQVVRINRPINSFR